MKLLLQNKNAGIPAGRTDKLKWSIWNDIIDVDNGAVVVFNTHSQTAILMSASEYLTVEQLTEDTKRELHGQGMLVPADIDERAAWERVFIEKKKDMSYIDLTILLTQNCQMRCVYCFEGAKEKKNIQTQTMGNILSFLESRIGRCRKLRVTWFGGEPLLAYSRLKKLSTEMMNFCKLHGIEYSADITTNGFALNETRCEELLTDLNVKRYIITIDGPAAIHDMRRPLQTGKPSFPIIWRNITTLVKKGAWVTLRMTIDKDNAEHIPALLDEVAAGPLAGYVGLSFCRTIDYNYTPKQISKQLYTETEFADVEWQLMQYAHHLGLWKYHFPHAAPSGGCLREGDIVIGVDGEIYKCLDTVGNSRWITGYIGPDISEKETNPKWYNQWHQWTPMKSEKCKECVLIPLCNGGCPHNALFADKKHGTESSCPDWKANYRKQIKSLITETYTNETI